jgi:hypothetical protein
MEMLSAMRPQIRAGFLGGTFVVAIAAICAMLVWEHNPLGGRELSSEDPRYKAILDEITIHNPDFIHLTNGEIEMARFSGTKMDCVFVYAKQPILYSDSDFLYCFEPSSTTPERI